VNSVFSSRLNAVFSKPYQQAIVSIQRLSCHTNKAVNFKNVLSGLPLGLTVSISHTHSDNSQIFLDNITICVCVQLCSILG